MAVQHERVMCGEAFTGYLEATRLATQVHVFESAKASAAVSAATKLSTTPNLWSYINKIGRAILDSGEYRDLWHERPISIITTTESIGFMETAHVHNLTAKTRGIFVPGEGRGDDRRQREEAENEEKTWFPPWTCFFSGTLEVLAMTDTLMQELIKMLAREDSTIIVSTSSTCRGKILWKCGRCEQLDHDPTLTRVPVAVPVLVSTRFVDDMSDEAFRSLAGMARSDVEKALVERAGMKSMISSRGRGSALEKTFKIPMDHAFRVTESALLHLTMLEKEIGITHPIDIEDEYAMLASERDREKFIDHMTLAVTSMAALRVAFQASRRYISSLFPKNHNGIIEENIEAIRSLIGLFDRPDQQRKRRKTRLPY